MTMVKVLWCEHQKEPKFIGEVFLSEDGFPQYSGPRKDAVEKLVNHFNKLGYQGESALDQLTKMQGPLKGVVSNKYSQHNRGPDFGGGSLGETEKFEPLLPDFNEHKVDLGNNKILHIGVK